MADDINTLQEGIVPAETLEAQEIAQETPPSTIENQLATEAVQIEQNKKRKAFEDAKSLFTVRGPNGNIIKEGSDEEALDYLEKEQQRLKNISEFEQQQQQADLEKRKLERRSTIEKALRLGQLDQIKRDEDLDDQILQDLNEVEQLDQAQAEGLLSDEQIVQKQNIANEQLAQDIENAKNPSAEDILNSQAQERKLAAESQAKELQNQENLKQQQQNKDIILKDLDRLESDVRQKFNIDTNLPKESAYDRYINKHQGWGKIGAAIGFVLAQIGAAAQGSDTNIITKMMQQEIEQETAEKKLNAQQRLQYSSMLNDIVATKMKRLADITKDNFKKQELNMMANQFKAKQDQEKLALFQEMQQQMQKQNLAQKVSGEEGITEQEFRAMQLGKDTKEFAKNAVVLADGRYRFANNPETAKKLTNEILPNTNSALKGVRELEQLTEEFLGGALDITDARAKAKVLQQSLVGNLRLELFGPGVLTDAEQKIAKEIIANPATIFSLRGAAKTSLKTLKEKLIYSTKQRLSKAGIKAPKSENERLLDQKLEQFKAAKAKNNPKVKGLKESDIINAFIKKYGSLDIKEF